MEFIDDNFQKNVMHTHCYNDENACYKDIYTHSNNKCATSLETQIMPTCRVKYWMNEFMHMYLYINEEYYKEPIKYKNT